MEELNLDELEKNINNKSAVEEKFTEVLKHKKVAEDKLEVESKARVEAELKATTLEKENSFLSSFSDINTKFPTASEYKDKIKEKVMTSGYSVEDATVAILHAEGKLTAPSVPKENVAGGSAPNQIVQTPTKSMKEMTSDERWAVLREEEVKGNIGLR